MRKNLTGQAGALLPVQVGQAWVDLIYLAGIKPTLTLSGVRKIVEDLEFSLPWSELMQMNRSLQYEDICYTKAKHAQLLRNYWNPEEVDAAFTKLHKRQGKDHSSVSIQMRGRDKDSRSQGFCMQNVVISVTPDSCTMVVYYRSTELIQKFLADLIFFSRMFPAQFNERQLRPPSVIRFKFANAYVSAMFMPIFCRFAEDPTGFFLSLQESDPKFFRLCGLTTRRFFQVTHNYTYKTRVKMWNYWKAHVQPRQLNKLEGILNKLKGEAPATVDEGDEDES